MQRNLKLDLVNFFVDEAIMKYSEFIAGLSKNTVETPGSHCGRREVRILNVSRRERPCIVRVELETSSVEIQRFLALSSERAWKHLHLLPRSSPSVRS